jgi:hypothetical protein
MTRLLKQAIATASAMADDAQDETAHLLPQFAGIEQEPYALSREENTDERLAVIRARIRASLDDPRPNLSLEEVGAHITAHVAKAEWTAR